METDPIVTTGAAARIAGVAGETIRQWERRGFLPALRTESGMRLYRRADVERVATERRQQVEVRRAR